MTSRTSLTFILSACLLVLTPSVLASAAAQFHLNLNTRASKCWVDCHAMVTSSTRIPALGDRHNGVELIDQNCQFDEYVPLMTQCFVQQCESAPDAAYATEFAHTICEKAGYEVEFVLPEAYMEAAKEYFESEGYLNGGGVRGVRVWGTGDLVFILATSFALSFLF